jgi:hypothetical protein
MLLLININVLFLSVDLPTIAWLQDFLVRSSVIVLFVSHDRYDLFHLFPYLSIISLLIVLLSVFLSLSAPSWTL